MDPALATGNVDLILETYAHGFIIDDSGRKVTGVEVKQKGERIVIAADVFICSAGAINSAALLLRSANGQHLRGLGNSSDQLERNDMAHDDTAMMAVNPTLTIVAQAVRTVDHLLKDVFRINAASAG